MVQLIPSGQTPEIPRSLIRKARFALSPSKRDTIRQKSFPNVPLVTHRGKTVRFYDDLLKNKIVVLSVISAQRAGACAPLMARLAEVQKLLLGWFAEDVHFYSITTTPEQDTPETLHAFADAHGVRGKWWLLTGCPTDVEYLRGVLGWTGDPGDPGDPRDDEGERLAEFVRYGNETRAAWGACDATTAAQRIAEDVSFVIRRPIRP